MWGKRALLRALGTTFAVIGAPALAQYPWSDDTLLAEGQSTAACCIIHGGGRSPEPVEIPVWFAQALEGNTDD